MFFILLLLLTHGRLSAAQEFGQATVEDPATEDPATEVEPATDELDRWVPSLSISLGMLLQRASADTETNDVNVVQEPLPVPPTPTDPFDPTIVESASGQDLVFAPISHLSLELMTPALRPIPGRPRLFAHADAALNFSQTYDLARVDKPGEFAVPKGASFRASDILGQGVKAQVHVDDLVWSAGGGVAFTFDVFERRLRIKPSFEWIRQTMVVEGDFRRLVQLRRFPPGPGLTLDDFRPILLFVAKNKVFHGIGPGLEIEVDSNRAGPFVVSTFLGVRVYRILGDRNLKLDTENEFGETATYRYKNRRVVYQGAMGIRIRWAPE
jgi:hypothetical protein